MIDLIPETPNHFKQRYSNRLNGLVQLAKNSVTGTNCHSTNGYSADDEEEGKNESLKISETTNFRRQSFHRRRSVQAKQPDQLSAFKFRAQLGLRRPRKNTQANC